MMPQSGTVYEYAPKLMAFELNSFSPQNVVVFVGGLTDGLLTVPYLSQLASSLNENGWGLIQCLITSSYQGWGTGSLRRDAIEINKLVKFLRLKGKSKIVLMGHSTGCQDTMEYLTNLENATEIEGGILQAPVSDREGMEDMFSSKEELDAYNCEAKSLIDQERGNEVLPKKFTEKFFGGILSAYRWYSLAAVGGDDDYFSSDLDEKQLAKTFGKLDKPILALPGEKDEFTPTWVDKKKLLESWRSATKPEFWSGESKILPGAKHNIGAGSDDCAVPELCRSVVAFVKAL